MVVGVLSDLFGKCKSVTKIVLVRISQERQGLYGEPPLWRMRNRSFLVDTGQNGLEWKEIPFQWKLKGKEPVNFKLTNLEMQRSPIRFVDSSLAQVGRHCVGIKGEKEEEDMWTAGDNK